MPSCGHLIDLQLETLLVLLPPPSNMPSCNIPPPALTPPHRKAMSTLLPPVAETIPSIPLELEIDNPSIFDVLNIFRCHWFLNRDHLITNCLSSQKDESNRIFWVAFQPTFHMHLVQQALTLLPPSCPVEKGKKCMFVFVLEVLTSEGPGPEGLRPFFKLPKKTHW